MARRLQDHRRAPEFPGAILHPSEWTRTRVSLGPRGRRLDWEATFGRTAGRVVDLGCGNGRYLIGSALLRPQLDHLGIELVPQALRMAVARAGERGLRNCKFAWGNASEFLRERVAPATLDEVHLYHPQPYFAEHQAERRQLTPEILLALWRALKPGGRFVFQTDSKAYWKYAGEIGPALFEWREHRGVWPDAPHGRTLREIRARAQGLHVWRASARRKDLDEGAAVRAVDSLPQPRFDANRPAFRSPKKPPR